MNTSTDKCYEGKKQSKVREYNKVGEKNGAGENLFRWLV